MVLMEAWLSSDKSERLANVLSKLKLFLNLQDSSEEIDKCLHEKSHFFVCMQTKYGKNVTERVLYWTNGIKNGYKVT